MDKPVKPTFGRYYVRTRSVALVLGAVDLVIAPLQAISRKAIPITPPRSILVSNMGSLGDAVVSTSVIPIIKSAFPKAKIGFLVARASAPFFECHPDVHYVHVMDHWLNKRGSDRSLKDQWATIRGIKARSYDVVLELFPRVQNAIPLAWFLRIPVRIGYTSGGFGPLLTHRLDWEPKRRHVSQWHFDLLRFLPLHEADIAKAQVSIVSFDHESFMDKYRLAGGSGRGGYVLLHIGAIAANRKWLADKWRKLTCMLADAGKEVVFTGYGKNDEQDVADVVSGLQCVNLCGRLSMKEYIAAVESACLVVCVDTVAQHIAAGFNIPCVVLMNGIHPYIWYPMHDRYKSMFMNVECVPCFRPNACKGLECLHGVQVKDVYNAIEELLAVNK